MCIRDRFNRRGFLTLAEYALLTAQRRHEPVSLAFVDLDRFKHINDTWGHEEGDRALIAIADLMKSAFRESDILARQGGDEFIILFANTSPVSYTHLLVHREGPF